MESCRWCRAVTQYSARTQELGSITPRQWSQVARWVTSRRSVALCTLTRSTLALRRKFRWVSPVPMTRKEISSWKRRAKLRSERERRQMKMKRRKSKAFIKADRWIFPFNLTPETINHFCRWTVSSRWSEYRFYSIKVFHGEYWTLGILSTELSAFQYVWHWFCSFMKRDRDWCCSWVYSVTM